MQTGFEEAKLCPKCGQPGEDRKQKASSSIVGATIHFIYCVTKLCSWYDTAWLVQVNADGTIPSPRDHTYSPKIYEGFADHDRIAKNIIANLEAQRALETQAGGHGEVRR